VWWMLDRLCSVARQHRGPADRQREQATAFVI
jgi:hypothetical protein